MDAGRPPHVAQTQDTARVDPSRWPLVGRDDELALATSALSEQGSVVLIGAAGVGKTRLAHEVLARIGTSGDRTDWVAATHSARSIPLGAVAHLVPDGAVGRDRDTTLRGIVGALRRQDGERLLLGVDDAHLLDDASAALVNLLIASGSAAAVVTLRSGEPVADAIAALWKDGQAPLVALQPLARVEVDSVVTSVLGGLVDGATLQFLWESSRGNAFFLRELVQHGLESGALKHEQGMWRWRGQLEPNERLHSVVAMRMGALSDVEREALEVVAVGQPLTIDCLNRLANTDVVQELERRGLVESRRQEGRVVVALAHPLFGEVLRDRLPVTRRDEVQIALADAVEASGAHSATELLRIALWRVEAGASTRTELIRAAARRALELWDPVVAERLARVALAADVEIEATYILGAALSDQNRAAEALEAFRLARSLPGPDRVRAAVAADEAGVLSHQFGRLADAERVLSETLADISDPAARAILEGGRAAIVVSGGVAAGRDPVELTNAVPTTVLAAMIEHATAGRLDEAVQLAREQLATAPQWTADFPTIELYTQLTLTWALVLRGDVIDAQTRAEDAYRAALEEHAEFPRMTWSFVRGLIALVRGQPRTAIRALREAAGGFEGGADRGFLRPSHANLAIAEALLGNVEAAAVHLDSAHEAKPSYDGLFGIDVARAGAWLSAARGEISAAAEGAERAAQLAAEQTAWALAVPALHDAARFGRAARVVGQIETLTEFVDGALVRGVAARVRALVDDDGSALDRSAQTFASLGFDLFAAESSAAAARAHRHAGRRSSAFSARERTRVLAARCESAHSPALLWADHAEDLTAREREVAELAAGDLPSRAIAERLGITTRTVDNLLGRVYVKLGISRRRELAELFARSRGS